MVTSFRNNYKYSPYNHFSFFECKYITTETIPDTTNEIIATIHATLYVMGAYPIPLGSGTLKITFVETKNIKIPMPIGNNMYKTFFK